MKRKHLKQTELWLWLPAANTFHWCRHHRHLESRTHTQWIVHKQLNKSDEKTDTRDTDTRTQTKPVTLMAMSFEKPMSKLRNANEKALSFNLLIPMQRSEAEKSFVVQITFYILRDKTEKWKKWVSQNERHKTKWKTACVHVNFALFNCTTRNHLVTHC